VTITLNLRRATLVPFDEFAKRALNETAFVRLRHPPAKSEKAQTNAVCGN
jgi:hypothetical protein